MEFMQLRSVIQVSQRNKFLRATKQIEKINLGISLPSPFCLVHHIKLSTRQFKSMIIPKR